MRPLRSILAIVVGFVVIGVLSFATGAALVAAGVNPTSVGLLLFATLYVAVYATFGCWLAAVLAPSHPMRHALILGALGLVFNLAGAAAAWGQQPAWYLVLNLALVMPYAWLGGRLREIQLQRSGRLATS
ncbi:MAG TPA: hypothetical protein VJT67_00105 [Longimicrobiaceae bacterium]|nr:hypothetical protein [Longimicrobiaceae bacterium]